MRQTFTLHPPPSWKSLQLKNPRSTTAELFLGIEGELSRYFVSNPPSRFARNVVIESAFDERVSFPVITSSLQDLACANWQDEAGVIPLPLSFVLDKLRRAICQPKDLEVASLRQLVLPDSPWYSMGPSRGLQTPRQRSLTAAGLGPKSFLRWTLLPQAINQWS